jgi:dihydroflavonol-4-reductase
VSVKVLLTGATGFIGFNLAEFLTRQGVDVVALVRKGSDTSRLEALGVQLAWGDIRDYDSVVGALRGCRELYHVAADYRLWVPDPATMYEINVQGTKNVMEAALKAGIEKVVYTSTVGVLATNKNGKLSDEETPAGIDSMVGHYKKSKYLAEKEVFRFIGKGVPAVIVNPSTPVGPVDRKPTPTGKMIVDFMNGKIPAYLDTGLNFIDVADVAAGHWLAARKGKIGRRYILGNSNITLRDFFSQIARLTGLKPPRMRLPYFPVLLAAYVDEAISRCLKGRQPAIPLTGVKMAGKYMFFDSSRAVRELDLPQSPVENAMEKAIVWFRKNGYIVAHGGR